MNSILRMNLAKQTALAATILLSHLSSAQAAYGVLTIHSSFKLADLTTGVETFYEWGKTSQRIVSAYAEPFSGERNMTHTGVLESVVNVEADRLYRVTQSFSYTLNTMREGDSGALVSVYLRAMIDGSGGGFEFVPAYYGPGGQNSVVDQFGFYFTATTKGPKVIQAGGYVTAMAASPLVPDVPTPQVPEPSSFAMVLSGMLAFLGGASLRRRFGRG